MTMPDGPGGGDGSQTQLAMAIAEIRTDVRWIKDQLQSVLPDHERRIHEGEIARAQDRGARDSWARVLSVIAVLAAIFAAVAAWLALTRHH